MLQILIINIFLFFHPVHVTLTTVNQGSDNDTLKLFFRMYYDDFQLDYKLFYPDLNPGKNDENYGLNREMLGKYFNARVHVYINKKLLTGELSDVSVDKYEIRLNMIYHSVKKPEVFRIKNRVLTRIYNDQANMIYLNINKYEEAIKLTVNHDDQMIRLK